MMSKTESALWYRFYPGNPAIFGSADRWDYNGRVFVTFASMSGEMNIRAGRDSDAKYIRAWYRGRDWQAVRVGDRISIAGTLYLVVHVNDSEGPSNYIDAREVQ
jgi:hypothetical protein